MDNILDTAMGDAQPIPMVLYCPACDTQHIDEPNPSQGWANPPHRSHQCQACGHIWRPADVATTGVAVLQTTGKADGSASPMLAKYQCRVGSNFPHRPL